MKLQKIYIKNFRGIKEVFIDFQGKTNLLIGDNGCGKTTILEAVDLCFNSKLEKEDLHNLEFGSNNNAIACCIFDENIKQDAGEGESFNAIVHKTHIEDEDEKISQSKYLFSFKLDITKDLLLEEINKDKKTLKDKEIKNPQKLIYYMPAIDLDDPSKSAGDKSMFAKIYENLKNDTEIKEILSNYNNKSKAKTKDIFNDEKDGIKNVLKEYFGIENIDYEYNGSDGITTKINIVNRYGDKTSENLSHAGSGIRKIIKFIARTKFDGQQKSIFLIDEPEQNLHPDFQKSLIKFLKDEGIQCIFTSHSPTFVKHCMNNENCEVLICEKDGEKIEIKQMKDKIEKDYKFLENHTNSQAVANFLAFNEYSTDLHNLLYGLLFERLEQGAKLQRFDEEYFKEGNEKLKFKENVIVLEWKENEKKAYSVSLPTYIRNLIHHMENKLNADITDKEITEEHKKKIKYQNKITYLEQSINEMIKLLK